jgi:LysR family hydrogen peroxide-inducible transcriptional activator
MDLSPLPLTLRQLQYAVAIAETGSFRRAAERCRVAQPSLSAQIAQLEGALGARLFERDRRGVRPTRAGEEVLERARRVLVEARDLAEAARGLGEPLAGRLRLGVIPTVAPYLLPELAPRLRRAFPRLRVAWVEDRTPALVAAVSRGELDGALLAAEADLEGLEVAPLRRDPFVLAAPRGHPLASGQDPLALRELASERVLLLDEGHCLRDQALALCRRARAEELELRATSLGTLAQMVASGEGVTLLPSMAVASEARRAGVVVRRFADPAPARTIALAWRRGAAIGEAMRRLAAALRPESRRPQERR